MLKPLVSSISTSYPPCTIHRDFNHNECGRCTAGHPLGRTYHPGFVRVEWWHKGREREGATKKCTGLGLDENEEDGMHQVNKRKSTALTQMSTKRSTHHK